MAESVILHFGIGWRTYKAHAGVFIISMLTLLAAWIVLEIAVITLQNLGLVVWLILHLAFFFFFARLMVGFHRLTLRAVEGKTPALSTLTGSLNRGPTFLLAATIYFMAVVCGFVLLIIPGIYIAVRYALFGHVVANTSTTAVECLKYAATLSRNRWWSFFGFVSLALFLNLAGAALLGVGLFLTFPVSLLAGSNFYRSLPQQAS